MSAPVEDCFITHVLLANVSGADAEYTILHVMPDESGDEDSAIAWGTLLPGRSGNNSHRYIQLDIPIRNIGETIQVKSSVASAITFSFYGDQNL